MRGSSGIPGRSAPTRRRLAVAYLMQQQALTFTSAAVRLKCRSGSARHRGRVGTAFQMGRKWLNPEGIHSLQQSLISIPAVPNNPLSFGSDAKTCLLAPQRQPGLFQCDGQADAHARMKTPRPRRTSTLVSLPTSFLNDRTLQCQRGWPKHGLCKPATHWEAKGAPASLRHTTFTRTTAGNHRIPKYSAHSSAHCVSM